MGQLVGGMKSVSDFLCDLLSVVQEQDWITVLGRSSPWWVQAVGVSAKESLPLIGFVLKYAEQLTKERDPQKQGYTACTVAYNRAVEQAIRARSADLKIGAKQVQQAQRLDLGRMPEDLDMTGFRVEEALSHGFVQQADQVFRQFAEGVGLEEQSRNQLVRAIHSRFVENVRLLLGHPDSKEVFGGFADLLQFDPEIRRTQKALEDHWRYQWWQFNEAPIFGREPFALSHVYIETHCGEVRWDQIKGGGDGRGWRRSRGSSSDPLDPEGGLNPFSEVDCPRQDLLASVWKLIEDPAFKEPIVIQGVAGAGKSSFTLRLMSELIEEGLKPIRIQLKHLDLTESVLEALPRAIRFGDKQFQPFGWEPKFDPQWFTRLRDDSEEFAFGSQQTPISPYVLILDGWDEIATGATPGFKDEVDRVLGEIRSAFIHGRGHRPPIRVIVTGRPSVDITRTRLLRKDTPILTIRPFTPDQLEAFVQKILSSRLLQPLLLEPDRSEMETDQWTQISQVLDVYKQGFERLQEDHRKGNTQAELEGSLAVLGMPLLAYLTILLIVKLASPDQVEALINIPTTLYRALVDMTYEKGGKPSDAVFELERGKPSDADVFEPEQRHRITGDDLRVLLWGTAAAITATGQEAISREELKLRLDWDDDRLESAVEESDQENKLSNLIISFFFKEGYADQGCEFLHKSFREYLFAEGIVELLKDYGRDPKVASAYEKDPDQGLAEWSPYWKDFEEEDPRYNLSRRLAERLATQWCTSEIKAHLTSLLRWEVERVCQTSESPWPGRPTDPLSLQEWEFVRDGLADLWAWWGEAVILSPQPKLDKRHKTPTFDPPYILELTKLCSPQDPNEWKRSLPDPVSFSTVDGRLGDALCHLTAVIHAELLRVAQQVAQQQDGIPDWRTLEIEPKRRYQTRATENPSLVQFAPSGEDRNYFRDYSARINASGGRPRDLFPALADLSSANLSSANLSSAYLRSAYLRSAYLSSADLSSADLRSADLSDANLRFADLRSADLSDANLRFADLISAKYNIQTQFPEDFDPDASESIYGASGMIYYEEEEIDEKDF